MPLKYLSTLSCSGQCHRLPITVAQLLVLVAPLLFGTATSSGDGGIGGGGGMGGGLEFYTWPQSTVDILDRPTVWAGEAAAGARASVARPPLPVLSETADSANGGGGRDGRTADQDTVLLRNTKGQPYLCHVPSLDTDSPETAAESVLSEAAAAAAAADGEDSVATPSDTTVAAAGVGAAMGEGGGTEDKWRRLAENATDSLSLVMSQLATSWQHCLQWPTAQQQLQLQLAQQQLPWWSYEVCPGRSVLQYHEERAVAFVNVDASSSSSGGSSSSSSSSSSGGGGDGKRAKYVRYRTVQHSLGSYDSETIWSADAVKALMVNDQKHQHNLHHHQQQQQRHGYSGRGRGSRYHSQYFVNGSECDVTGERRSAEVRYGCFVGGASGGRGGGGGGEDAEWLMELMRGDGGEAGRHERIVSVTEPRSCHYLITVLSPPLCRHWLLGAGGGGQDELTGGGGGNMLTGPPPLQITCRPLITAQQLLQLVTTRWRRQLQQLQLVAARLHLVKVDESGEETQLRCFGAKHMVATTNTAATAAGGDAAATAGGDAAATASTTNADGGGVDSSQWQPARPCVRRLVALVSGAETLATMAQSMAYQLRQVAPLAAEEAAAIVADGETVDGQLKWASEHALQVADAVAATELQWPSSRLPPRLCQLPPLAWLHALHCVTNVTHAVRAINNTLVLLQLRSVELPPRAAKVAPLASGGATTSESSPSDTAPWYERHSYVLESLHQWLIDSQPVVQRLTDTAAAVLTECADVISSTSSFSSGDHHHHQQQQEEQEATATAHRATSHWVPNWSRRKFYQLLTELYGVVDPADGRRDAHAVPPRGGAAGLSTRQQRALVQLLRRKLRSIALGGQLGTNNGGGDHDDDDGGDGADGGEDVSVYVVRLQGDGEGGEVAADGGEPAAAGGASVLRLVVARDSPHRHRQARRQARLERNYEFSLQRQLAAAGDDGGRGGSQAVEQADRQQQQRTHGSSDDTDNWQLNDGDGDDENNDQLLIVQGLVGL